MAQRVEDINGLVKLISDEKAEIINKVNELNQNEEINEILTVSLPQIEELINSRFSTTLEQFSALSGSLNSVISAQNSLSKTSELEEFFSSLKTDVNNFYNELLNQHNFLESVRQKLNDINEDKSDRDEVINSVMTIKSDMENFNRSLESYVIDINSNLQNILRHILTMDTTEQNDIIKRELENIFLSSNAILSSLEISDKKDDEMYNVISSVENKIDELIDREPVNAVKAIKEFQSAVDAQFNKTSSEINKIDDNFKSLSSSNLERILSDIESSSAKIDELNAVIQEDFAQNLSSIKSLVENISIDTPSITPENPALSGKLDDILKAINNIEIPNIPEYDIEQNINILKNSLGSISEILNSIKLSDNGEAAEKLTSLEVALSQGISHYDDNIIALNNNFSEYISSIQKISELTDEKLDNSISGISEVKLEIKGLLESLEQFNSKADLRLETSLESFKEVDATIREKLDEITNTIRISSDSTTSKFENINSTISTNLETVNEKLDNISSSIDTRLNGVNELLTGSTAGLNETISGQINDAVNIINQNNTEVGDRLNNLSTVMEERLTNVSESLNQTSTGMNTVIENTSTAIQDNINLINENISSRNDKVNEKLDNITSAIDEKINNVNDSLIQTTDGLHTIVESTGMELQGKINLVNEYILLKSQEVHEKLDNFSSAIDNKLGSTNESIVQTTDGIHSLLETTGTSIQENINLVNENISSRNDKVNEKLDNISTIIDEKVSNVNESLLQTTNGIHSLLETTSTSVQENINLINENISSRNDIVNEKLDNLSSVVNERLTNVSETLNQTSAGLNSIIENSNTDVQEKINIVNENLTTTGTQINEKLDNVTTIVSENLNNVSGFLTQTSENLNTYIESTNSGIQEKINIVNETISTNSEKFNEKFDNFSADMDAKLNSVSGTLNMTSNAINSAISTTESHLIDSLNTVSNTIASSRNDLSLEIQNINTSIAENVGNLINQTLDSNSQNLDEKLNAINTSLKDQLLSIDESLSVNTANMNTVSENVNSSIQNGINVLTDELKTNSITINEKLDDVTNAINSQLSSVNDALNMTTETFGSKVESLTGDLLEQLKNANEKAGLNSTDINATIADLNISMKDCIDNISSTLSANTANLNEKTENIEGTLKEQLGTVNAALADNIEHINQLLGDVNSTVESKLCEINSNVDVNVSSIKECFDSALSALDMVRTDIIDNLADNNDSLTELVNNTIKEIKEINTGTDDDMQDKFTNLREQILAVILELQARQEEMLSITKRSDERNLQALDDISITIKTVENNLQTTTNEYKQLFEVKMAELKNDVDIIQQMLSGSDGEFNEKIFNKLFTVEALINEVSDKYEEKLTTLSSSITNYINNVQKNNEDAEIKLGNSVSEIAEIRNDLQKIADELNTVENNQDVKFYELTENLNSKIEDIILNIAGLKDIVQVGAKDELKQNLSELDLRFEQLFASLNKVKEFTPENIDQSFIELEEKLGAVKQEINLVNTDIIDAIDTKTSSIIENFAPIREAVTQILDFDFSQIITEVKTQVELSYLNLTSDLNSSLTMSQEAVSKLETVFKDVAKKIIAIDNQMTDFSRNNLEILNLTIENINKVVEKNLDETTTLSIQWKSGIEAIEEKIAAANEQYELSLKNYMDNLKEELQKNIDTNFENIKSFVSVVANEEDALHSIDILKEELSNRMEVLTNSFREEIAKTNGQTADMQKFSTDMKSYMDKLLVNFAKHIETSVNGNSLSSEQINEVLSNWASNLNSDIIKEFDSISDKLSDIQTTINLNDTSDISKNIQETLEALHEKVDVLAMSDDSSEDIIYEIEDIKNILTKVSGKSEEFNDLLKEINKIEESSSKNANDIKESVMSAIIAVFDQISFVEESEDIKDFVEEKTDEINQNLIEVRNQLKQIGVGDSQDYSYTLQDVESDIAKLRMVLNEMSQSSSSDDVLEILDNIHKISGSIDGLQASLTTDQIYDLKNDVERLNEDIVSISTRTNKLLLTSDESYKALNNGLDEFSKVILKLEERINILDNTKNSERIEKKLDNVNSMVSVIANSSKVMNQVMMYLGEWIDTTSENIGAISEKTSEIDEIKEIITDLRDTIPSKSAILDALENRFEEQQQRLDRLEMKFDRVLALLEDRDDARLNKKFERIEKQMTKLSINIEKLASYVDE